MPICQHGYIVYAFALLRFYAYMLICIYAYGPPIYAYMHMPIAAPARSKMRYAASARTGAPPSLLFRTPASSVLASQSPSQPIQWSCSRRWPTDCRAPN